METNLPFTLTKLTGIIQDDLETIDLRNTPADEIAQRLAIRIFDEATPNMEEIAAREAEEGEQWATYQVNDPDASWNNPK